MESKMTNNKIYAMAHAAAEMVGVTMPVLGSKKRGQHVAQMRQEFCWYMREAAGLSQPKIGALINKDHSTVNFALKKIDKMFQNGSRARLQKNLDILRALTEPPNDLCDFDPPLAMEQLSVGALRSAYMKQRKQYAEKVRLLDVMLSNLEGTVETAKRLHAIF